MRIGLHNKCEVFVNGKIFTAFNTMHKTVFEKIKNLQPYSGYFAFGIGSSEMDANAEKLEDFCAIYACTTETVQNNVLSGDIFATRSVSFGVNDAVGLEFYEIGLASDNVSNPNVYNRVRFLDDDGNPVKITKSSGDEMVVRMTIYLDIQDNGDGAKFVAGDNKLISQLLGENALSNTDLYFDCGANLQPNEPIYRGSLKNPNPVLSTKTTRIVDDGVVLSFEGDLGARTAYEFLVFADSKPVIRLNGLYLRGGTSKSAVIAKNTNNTIFVDSYVSSISSVKDNGTDADITYASEHYAHSFGDFVGCPFEAAFNSSTQRYKSKDGGLIGFVHNSTFYLYQNENLLIRQVDASAFSLSNVVQVLMAGDIVISKLNTSPYIKAYVVRNFYLESLTLDQTAISGFSFNLSSLDLTCSKAGKVMIGGIDSNNVGQCAIGKVIEDSLVFETSVSTTISPMDKAVATYHNNVTDSELYFITISACINGISGFSRVQVVDADGTLSTPVGQSMAYDLMTNSAGVYGAGRVIYSQKSSLYGGSMLNSYFLPELVRFNIPYEDEIKIWVSPDFNYCIKQFSGNTFGVTFMVNYATLTSFEDDILTHISFVPDDFEFLKDTLLIFNDAGADKIVAINLNKSQCYLENLESGVGNNIKVEYKKFSPLGSGVNEKVKMKLNLMVKGER
ncbi:MAG: hypothetical protein IJS68_03370 [Clostridia bacterium]|nr:hypothetical protein [Clostridia bacterium]